MRLMVWLLGILKFAARYLEQDLHLHLALS